MASNPIHRLISGVWLFVFAVLLALPASSAGKAGAGARVAEALHEARQAVAGGEAAVQGGVLTPFEEFTELDLYMGNAKPTGVTVEEYDTASGTWLPPQEIQFAWDAEGKMTMMTMEVVEDTGGGLETSWMRIRLDYDTDGNMTTMTIGSRETEDSAWVDIVRVVGTYDAEGRLTEEVTEVDWGSAMGGDASWMVIEKYEHEYSGDMRIKTTTSEPADFLGVQFTVTGETDYTYDDNGNLTTKVSTVDDGSGTLVNSVKYEYTYDAGGEMTSEARYSWDGVGWVGEEKLLYSRTDKADGGYELTVVTQVDEGSGWVDDTRQTMVFSSAGMPTGGTEETWDGSAWVESGTTTITSDAQGRPVTSETEACADGACIPVERMTFSYGGSGIVTARAGARHRNGLRVDAARGRVAVSFTLNTAGSVDLTVRDMRGRRIAAPQTRVLPAGTHTVTLPSAAITPGKYVVRMKTESAVSRSAFTIVE